MSDRDQTLRSCSTFDRGLHMISQQNPDGTSIDAQLQVTNLHPMCWIDCFGLPLHPSPLAQAIILTSEAAEAEIQALQAALGLNVGVGEGLQAGRNG